MSEPIRILLVEDDLEDVLIVTETLRDALRAEPYELNHVASLADARAHLSRKNADVVLLDLLLPDSGGTQTVEQVHAAAPRSWIIVLTGYDAPTLAAACLAAGARSYLPKSNLDATRLHDAVMRGVGRLRGRA